MHRILKPLHQSHRPRFALAGVLPFVLFLFPAGSRSADLVPSKIITAQPSESTLFLTEKELSAFPDALHTLARQASVAFVVEDMPLYGRLTREKTTTLASACANMPLNRAVEQVANAYDYVVTRHTGGNATVFVLKKRFTDPHDLPAVTPQECQAALSDINLLIKPYVPVLTHGLNQMYLDVIDSLTPEQVAQMKAKTLRVSSLRSDQHSLTWIVAANIATTGVNTGLANHEALDAVTTGKPIFKIVKGQFGWEWKPSYLTVPVFEPFSSPSTDAQTSPEVALARTAWVQAEQNIGSSSALPKTLETVVAAFNAHYQGVGTSVVLDPLIASKPVMLVGEDAITNPRLLLDALAEVYGLRLLLTGVTKTGDTRPNKAITGSAYRLQAFRARKLVGSDFRVLYDEAMQTVPDPLRRALHWADLDRNDAMTRAHYEAQKKLPTSAVGDDNPVDLWTKELKRLEEGKFRLQSLGSVWYPEIANRLRDAVVPRLTKLEKKGANSIANSSEAANSPVGIMVAEMTPAERSMLAFQFSFELLNLIRRYFPQETPTEIARFDDLYLMGGTYQDKEGTFFSFFFGLPDAQNKETQTLRGAFHIRMKVPPPSP